MRNEIVELDLKDKKILFELDFNARLPASLIGKKVGLSKQGVEYRIQNLIKKKVIQGFYPVVNVPKLGYHYCRLTLTLQQITKDKKKELIDYLISNPKIFWVFDMQGPYDLFIVAWTKDINEFRELVDDLIGTYGSYIKKRVENIGTDVIHFQNRYLLGKNSVKEVHIAETSERVFVDEIDKSILKALCKDARISLVDMSKEVGESAKVIAYRIKKMQEKKLIECYRPIINYSLIGYTYYKLFINLNSVSKSSLQNLKNHIKRSPNLLYIIEGIGLHADLDIELVVKSNKDLFDFIDDLRFNFPALIGDYQTVVFMNTLKVRYLPF